MDRIKQKERARKQFRSQVERANAVSSVLTEEKFQEGLDILRQQALLSLDGATLESKNYESHVKPTWEDLSEEIVEDIRLFAREFGIEVHLYAPLEHLYNTDRSKYEEASSPFDVIYWEAQSTLKHHIEDDMQRLMEGEEVAGVQISNRRNLAGINIDVREEYNVLPESIAEDVMTLKRNKWKKQAIAEAEERDDLDPNSPYVSDQPDDVQEFIDTYIDEHLDYDPDIEEFSREVDLEVELVE